MVAAVEFTLESSPSSDHGVAILSTVLHEARDLVVADAAAAALVITVVPAYGGVALDRVRVVHLLALLLRNAIPSVPAGGRVAVTAHESERHVVFAVYDSAWAPRTVNEDVRELARALGGRLDADSRAGSGTVVLLTLPRRRA